MLTFTIFRVELRGKTNVWYSLALRHVTPSLIPWFESRNTNVPKRISKTLVLSAAFSCGKCQFQVVFWRAGFWRAGDKSTPFVAFFEAAENKVHAVVNFAVSHKRSVFFQHSCSYRQKWAVRELLKNFHG